MKRPVQKQTAAGGKILKNPSILGFLVKTHNRVKNLMGKPRT